MARDQRVSLVEAASAASAESAAEAVEAAETPQALQQSFLLAPAAAFVL